MTKKDVFLKLLLMFQDAEKSVNRLISGDDVELINYGIEKIDLMVTRIAEMYEEAEQ